MYSVEIMIDLGFYCGLIFYFLLNVAFLNSLSIVVANALSITRLHILCLCVYGVISCLS